MERNQCSGQFCHLAIKLLPHYFLSILERQVLGGPGWKMPGPHQKFSSPSLLTKQHPFSFSFLFSLQTFPSSLKSTHPNIVLVNGCGLNLCFPMAFEQSTRFLWRKSDDMPSYFCGGNQALLAIGDTDSDNHTGRGEQAYIYIYLFIYIYTYIHHAQYRRIEQESKCLHPQSMAQNIGAGK